MHSHIHYNSQKSFLLLAIKIFLLRILHHSSTSIYYICDNLLFNKIQLNSSKAVLSERSSVLGKFEKLKILLLNFPCSSCGLLDRNLWEMLCFSPWIAPVLNNGRMAKIHPPSFCTKYIFNVSEHDGGWWSISFSIRKLPWKWVILWHGCGSKREDL